MTVQPKIDLTDAATFPSRRTEAWKYSDLRRVLKDAPPPSPRVAIVSGGPFAMLGGAEMTFANGHGEGDEMFAASGEQTLRLRFVSDAAGTSHTAKSRIPVAPGARPRMTNLIRPSLSTASKPK